MAKQPDFGSKADDTAKRNEGSTLMPRPDSDRSQHGIESHPSARTPNIAGNTTNTPGGVTTTGVASVSAHEARSQPGIMAGASPEQARNVGATDVPRGAEDPAMQGLPTPAHMVPKPLAGQPGPEPDPVLVGVKRGDLVRLLESHFDGFQLLAAGSVVRWWNDTPPSSRTCAYADAEITPLTAPAMTDGKPPETYLDPNTGKKPVIGSV